MSWKKNAPLWIGIGLPVLMVIVVAVSIYLPSLLARPPHYDFVYSIGGTDFYNTDGTYYDVQNGQIVQLTRSVTVPETKPTVAPTYPPTKFYLHDVETNTSRELTFAEASALRLGTEAQSPDGFEVVRGSYGPAVFPFVIGGDYHDTRYLKKGSYSHQLNLSRANFDSPYSYYFRFYGWVL